MPFTRNTGLIYMHIHFALNLLTFILLDRLIELMDNIWSSHTILASAVQSHAFRDRTFKMEFTTRHKVIFPEASTESQILPETNVSPGCSPYRSIARSKFEYIGEIWAMSITIDQSN